VNPESEPALFDPYREIEKREREELWVDRSD
jgi:hypothetical protein